MVFVRHDFFLSTTILGVRARFVSEFSERFLNPFVHLIPEAQNGFGFVRLKHLNPFGQLFVFTRFYSMLPFEQSVYEGPSSGSARSPSRISFASFKNRGVFTAQLLVD